MQESLSTTTVYPARNELEVSTNLNLRCGLILSLIIVFLLVLFQPAIIYSGDAISVRYSTTELINSGHLDVDQSIAQNFGERGQYFFENEAQGEWYPKYGILNTFLYIPPLLLERSLEGPLVEVQKMTVHERKSRVFYLNLYNILISLLIAAYLYLIALNFNHSAKVAAIYVLACLFGTFVWNYLRAQTFEIFQLCFFLGLYYSLLRFKHWKLTGNLKSSRTHFVLILVFCSLLVLEKLVFILLVPVTLLWILWADILSQPDQQQSFRVRFFYAFKHYLAAFAIFLTCLLTLVCLANWYRFGAPFTTGYAQWEQEKHFLSGNPFNGMYGYLFNSQKSIFLYFPLLFFSLFKFRSFLKQYTFEFSFVLIVFLVFYITNSCFINWRGDWCYGPRYLLFILPLLSLPVLCLLDHPSTQFNLILKGFLYLTLLVSTCCQMSVNMLTFSAPFNAIEYFKGAHNENVNTYFKSPFWTINFDLLKHKLGKSIFPPLKEIRPALTDNSFQKHISGVNSLCELNLYFLDQNQINHRQ
ncbi:hypothetical protein [Gimesia algae]|uniref:Glycosyltransferase RgtA/B/C/D-like domain-containing protein n=1 Tax=Gimesia algae TaxID=2527971 RepID=A0A517VFB7_9PLAN|nr:hypothetical protein [Gimesia algae]QDT91679.1 hypothetical protein Pan161_33410 [Gimesia algae]